MPVLWYRDPADQVMKPYPAGGPSTAGKDGYAGASLSTPDLLLTTANTRYGMVFENSYGTPSGMTLIPHTVGASAGAGITGNCSLFTIQKTGWYDVKVAVDAAHATANTEALIEICGYGNASEKGSIFYAKRLTLSAIRLPTQTVTQGVFNPGDVISFSAKCITGTGWYISYAQIIIVSL